MLGSIGGCTNGPRESILSWRSTVEGPKRGEKASTGQERAKTQTSRDDCFGLRSKGKRIFPPHNSFKIP